MIQGLSQQVSPYTDIRTNKKEGFIEYDKHYRLKFYSLSFYFLNLLISHIYPQVNVSLHMQIWVCLPYDLFLFTCKFGFVCPMISGYGEGVEEHIYTFYQNPNSLNFLKNQLHNRMPQKCISYTSIFVLLFYYVYHN